MPVKVITTEVGHSLAHEGPHTITFHYPGWNIVESFREGDAAVLGRLTSIYPRFGPFAQARKLLGAVHAKLGLPETHGCLAFIDPALLAVVRDFALSEHRKAHRLAPSELSFRAVDVAGIRLYVVAYPAPKTPGVLGIWQHQGVLISTRLAEELLKHVDTELAVVPWEVTATDGDLSPSALPAPTYLPEGEAHPALRERIAGLVNSGRQQSQRVAATDVFLYHTGMAAIFHVYLTALAARGDGDGVGAGAVVALGTIFHSTWHVFEEAPTGFKHFGPCSTAADLDKVEAYLEEEKQAGRRVPFLFAEFLSNPILASADLQRLRQLADKYDFPVVIDDTVGSFCNIDVLPFADVIVTSLTKSFSGYADVMGGSVVLNPASPHYRTLRDAFATTFHNAVFADDAAKLLANSADYLARSAILNRNAAALASYLETLVPSPTSAVTGILYPPQTASIDHYRAVMRAPTPDFPTPGYGCLLSIDFVDEPAARAFYDAVQFHKGPHLGAQETLVINFNVAVWGDNEELSKYHATYGNRREQLRISVGLEPVEDLLDTVKAALEVVDKARNGGQ